MNKTVSLRLKPIEYLRNLIKKGIDHSFVYDVYRKEVRKQKNKVLNNQAIVEQNGVCPPAGEK